MARPRKTDITKPANKAEAEVTPKPKVPKKPAEKTKIVVTSSLHLFHPYDKYKLDIGVPIEVDKIDSWLQSQIDAGIVKVH